MELIDINSVVIGENRQRKDFPEVQMLELRDSIFGHTNGLLNPILVRPLEDGKYLLVAGERRLRVIKANANKPYRFADDKVGEVPAGKIPAIIKHFPTELEAEEAELHENIVRLNLNWREKALAIKRLHEYKQSQNEKHSPGMTAKIIDTESKGDYASSTQYRNVHAALMVSDFIEQEDEDVLGASNLHQAAKIASRKMEKEALQKLRNMSAPKPTQVSQARPDGDPAEEDTVRNLEESLQNMIPPVPLPIKTPLGELHHGAAQIELDKVPDNHISVLITDPPYGVDAHTYKNSGVVGAPLHEYDDTYENATKVLEEIMPSINRVCRSNSHAYVFCSLQLFPFLQELYASNGWRSRKYPLIWDKGSMGKLIDGLPEGYSHTYEFIFHATRGSRKYRGVIPDIIKSPVVSSKVHAAQKPAGLYKELLGMSAIPGDYVLDPFCGSGTIFHAARDLNLKPIGIELSDDYILYAKEAQEG